MNPIKASKECAPRNLQVVSDTYFKYSCSSRVVDVLEDRKYWNHHH